MVKFTDLFDFYFWKPSSRAVTVGIVVAIFISIGIYYFVYHALPVMRKKTEVYDSTNVPNAREQYLPADIYFFNADWCPHCTKSKPAWEQFVDDYDHRVVKDQYQLHCIGGKKGVNCTDTSDPQVQELIQRFNVEHYPTVKLKVDGQIIDFDAKVTYENLAGFVQAIGTT